MKKNTAQKLEMAISKAVSSKAVLSCLSERKIDPQLFKMFALETVKEHLAKERPGIIRIPEVGDAFDLPIHDIDPSIFLPGRRLNLDAFGQELHKELSSKSFSGYSMSARAGGQDVYSLFWNWARRPQDTNSLGWKPSTKMHVASVSKLLTAMAIVKALTEMNMTVDNPIGPHLPSYLSLGSNVANLTFRHLLTQTSGFKQHSQGGANDGYTYLDLKAHLENGVATADIGTYRYHNVNFIALRVLLATITKELPINLTLVIQPNSFFPGFDLSDVLWDYETVRAYNEYVSYNIMRPSGVTGKAEGDDADSLAYSKSLSNPGALLNAPRSAGTAGWWLSTEDLTRIMETFRSSSAIVPRLIARRALASGFGLEPPAWWQFDRWGTLDCMTKSGYWSDGEGRTVQSIVAYAPPNFTIAVNVNSPIFPNARRSSVTYNIQSIVLSLLYKHIN